MRLKILCRTGKGVDFSKFIGRATTRLEKENISVDKKRSAVKELRSGDHTYTAFFVCRNPVEKMLSVWDHFRWHIANNKERGVLGARVTFYTWREFVTVVARCGTCQQYLTKYLSLKNYQDDITLLVFLLFHQFNNSGLRIPPTSSLLGRSMLEGRACMWTPDYKV